MRDRGCGRRRASQAGVGALVEIAPLLIPASQTREPGRSRRQRLPARVRSAQCHRRRAPGSPLSLLGPSPPGGDALQPETAHSERRVRPRSQSRVMGHARRSRVRRDRGVVGRARGEEQDPALLESCSLPRYWVRAARCVGPGAGSRAGCRGTGESLGGGSARSQGWPVLQRPESWREGPTRSPIPLMWYPHAVPTARDQPPATTPKTTEAPPKQGFRSDGARGTRTPDLLGAIQALSQLSYSPYVPPRRDS